MTLPKLRILIVDDNASDRLIVRSMFHKLGLKDTQEAENGSIAASKIGNAIQIHSAFDLIVMDWNMPQTSGFKLLKQIRKDFHTRKVKVIIMTSTSDSETVKAAIAEGADDFLVKPVDFESFKKKISDLKFEV